MARVRSVEFLPEIFQTDVNKQFLAATLDQLIQEPKFKKTQGFIGRSVGPGVNPNDRYVIEPNKTRADYQLEPGIVSLEPDTNRVRDVMTYPGILDAVAYQGGNASRPDRLFESQYYTWDPFVNWDTFINFSQYFWIPGGPASVDVAATGVPATDDFVVDRANGVYTFSGLAGNNPTIDLVRGGSYTFQVAQNDKETVNYRVSNAGISSYVIDSRNNPTLTLVRGNTYVFTMNLDGVYPFYIKTAPTTGLSNVYNSGVTNNGAVAGQVTFVVPQDAPDTLFYASATQSNMQGTINVTNAAAGTGPGFWIQTDPGVNGRVPITPNISSRDVFGVTNNGEDLGTVTFNVPTKTAQDFYYGGGPGQLNSIGTVDLITDLKFDQLDNVAVADFIAAYGGIDGITELNGRTIVFTQAVSDPELGGWYKTTLYDPLDRDDALNGQSGSYDSLRYAETNEVPLEQRFGIWQIDYVNDDGYVYMTLNSIQLVDNLDKFTVRYGNTYASTQWYKNDAGFFREVPLLTAAQDVLYYQDGTDPEIFGRIRLIEQTQSDTLFIDEILGKQSYTSPNGVVFTNGLKVVFRGQVEPAEYINKEYYISGVGTAIELLPVTNFVTPETYVVDGDGSTEATEPGELDYLTIDRAAQDLNAWSRSNRWFHIDVINATATYNNTEAVIDNAFRAKRPVIEFRPGLRMFNMGTEGKQPVNIIDFEQTDAFSNIEGSTGYSVGGLTFAQTDPPQRVIFAADTDANVRNKIWEVNFITPDSIPPFVAQPVIHLTLATDGEVLVDQSTVCLDGTTLKGISFWYNGVEWRRAQLKTSVQQAPLFDIYDADGVSFANLAKYPSTTFAGSKLFSYAVPESGVLDPVLQFPLQYLNLNNVGDIVFENNLYKDTFLYVRDNVSTTELISNGFVREYETRTVFQRQIGWNVAATDTQIRQQFKFTYTGEVLKLDVQAQTTNINVPAVQVYLGSTFRDPGSYTVATTSNSTTITLDNTYAIGDIVEVLVLSDQISQVAFYQVPINLEKNPINGNSDTFTLGTVRTHYESICENLTTLRGPINGANNTRDLGYIGTYGQVILQQSAPLVLAGYFNRSQDYNIFASLQYNSREYQKFKNLMLEEVTRLTIGFETPGQLLTQAMENLTAGRIEINPFYWSDMLPTGSVFIENSYTVGLITTNVFDTVQVYNYTSANYLGLLVYKNDQLLTRGFDYVVATDGPRITITVPLAVGDVVSIQEYAETYGNFVPNTPTKLGLYPAYRPEIVTTKTTTGTAVIIVGHDGSQTPAFNDIRDQVLLEFETRIYNNLKLDGNPVPLLMADVLPGNFRQTGYSYSDINDLLSTDFLSYVGWNKLDYTSQNYLPANQFSWNYSSSQNKLSFDRPDNINLLGAWRGINRYFYDTENPALTPWEMLGFTIKPTWWNTVYGPGPYTSDNLVLWDDLEAGRVADPAGTYVLPAYIRPGLTTVIPVDSEGNLASPFVSVVGGYDDTSFQKSWAAGDGGPVEASWWNSSAYPFAVMRVLALTRPAKFYSLFADRDLYRFDDEFGQFLYQDRYRLDANNITVYGDGVSKASYINWIVDYNRQSGTNSTAELEADLGSLDVRLCYRMASFSDKQYIKMYTEKSSPNSLNSTLLIPDESYDLLLYKNQPFDRTTYSSVIVQIVEGGYAVYGYSTTQPFFNIAVSQGIGRLKSYTAGNVTVQVPTVYTDTVVKVPYGFVFNNQTSVCDFLLSYGNVLEKQGLTFTDRSNGLELNWGQMAQEFLYWSQQGWEVNSLINLNPLAGGLSITKPQSVVDSVVTQTSENVLLNQNKRELPTKNLNIVRLDNTLTLQPLTTEALSFADLRFTNFEHMIVLNNRSVFGDLIYEPITGARQSRLNLVAVTSTEWNGTVDAQGFILNQDNVQEWTGLKKYSKGEIVKYKDQYWSAATIVDPSTEFKFDQWFKSDYEQLELGLLPNIANKADQLANSYSLNTANLELDNDLLSYGLIGFRQRQYMSALNLDDVSQVNVYQQFLKTKGTVLSAELLSQANLGKESADYKIFENWAVQRAVYGANANRSFVELRLNRALLNSNPSLVQVTLPQESSQADQPVLLSNVWRQSYKLTSPNFLPTTTTTVTDTALPTAGYVSLDDADITTFSLNDLSSIQANIDAVSVGTTIWAAKVNEYDWNIYRCVQVSGYVDHVCDNLDGTSICNFTQPHGLEVGDKLIIKFFDVEIDGVYEVLEVTGVNTVTIAYTFVGSQSQINGTGIGFTLQTQRVSQPSDILNLPYANEIQTGTKVWVDDAGNGQWAVLEKQNQFSDVVELAPELLDATEQYGQSIAQARSRLAALVGSPRYGFASGTATGGIYTYVKNFSGSYQPVSPATSGDAILVLGTTGVRGYGNAVDFGNQTWAVGGASQSLGPAAQADVGYAAVIYRDPALGQPGVNPYAQWQLLTPPVSGDRILPGEFGYSVAVSTDEHWMYIGSPGVNKVHAYSLVDTQIQFIRTLGDGVTTTYQIANAIQIDNNLQLEVSVNSNIQTLGVDYTINGFSEVVFTTPPPVGEVVDISRKTLLTITNSGTQQLATSLFTVNNINSFSVLADDVLLRPDIDYTYNNGTGLLTWINAPAGGVTIVVRADKHFVYVNTLTVAGLAADARFGHSVSTTTDGRQVLIGCADQTVDGKTEAGSVYVFDRNVQRFIYGTETSSVTFTVLGTVTAPVSVIVNNQFLTNQVDSTINADGTFTVSGNDVTIQDPLQVGDVIEIETNQFVLTQQVKQQTVNASNAVVDNPMEFTNFGQALDICSFNCSLYVGAPQDSTQEWKAGSVQRSVNQSRVYGTITATVANPVLTAGQTLRVNNTDVAVPVAGTVASLATAINSTVPNVTASVSTSGFLTIAVKNTDSAAPGNKLQVAPGSSTGSTVFSTLGFNTFVFTQSIYSPYPVEFAAFGSSVNIDDTADNLVVGAPGGTQYLVTEFDEGETDFDGNSTVFFSTILQSGVVYTYDYLPAANDSALNPGKFVFGLQIVDNGAGTYDNYGIAVNYTDGVLMVGAPGNDFGDSSAANRGRVFVFENPDRVLAWTIVREQQPVVDVRLLNSVFTYDRITSARTEFFDFFDPLQGKILGAARQNINYIGAVDPAAYNSGPVNNQGNTWTSSRVGEIWWDISTVRFVDPNQDNIVYASRRWGQVFPGSTVDVYQWIESTEPPASYTGPGTPLNVFSYSVNSSLSNDGTFNTYYYFWVRGITTVATNRGKTLSAETVARYIENPKASGIPYVAAVNASTVAIYNAGTVIEAEDTILSIEFDREFTNDNVHVEYELIAQDKEDGFLSDGLYRKLQDSFCGVDTFGNLVPDPNLNAAERYGVQFRPRQSMFVDRFEALKNYIVRANTVLARFPIVENRSFNLLNSSEPVPVSVQTYVAGTLIIGNTYTISSVGTTNFTAIGASSNTVGVTFVATGVGAGTGTASFTNWNLQVANLEILSFQNIDAVPLGYKYLVISDSSNNGLWTVYTVQLSQGLVSGVRELVLTQVQNYDTKRYWGYINWYLPGYNSSTKVVAEVPNFSTLETLNLPVGSSVLVTANAQGKFEIYLRTDIEWQRVALQDGTIEISSQIYDYALGRFGFDVEVFDAQYFDQEPVIETRKIIQAINEELFVDDLLLERNRSLVLMFNYVLSEFAAPEWLVKTSLIDVDHRIRELAPFQNFRQDNQEFVLDYIQEVKPYHVQIREFNLLYNGQDQYLGSLTDFDVPAYYDTNLTVPQYVSPILLPYDAGTAEADNTLSDAAADSLIWQAWPYSQWINNYLLTLDSITLVNPGTGFTDVPTVTIVGDAEIPATAQAFLNSLGEIAFISVITPGSGYRATPSIVFNGGNGTGAQAYAVMGNDLVRSFKTVIKYDRYQYQTDIVDWQPSGYYEDGTLVRYADQVWRASSPDSTAVSSATFEFDQWTLIPAANLSGVDRTAGYYVAGVNEPGLDLPLLIDGIDYPGVQVFGRQFTSNTDLDAVYSSSFQDIYLGTRFTDINVDGGEFIGPYEGHAPEELVNGAEYDTVDIRVYTRPGSDWSLEDNVAGNDGHGFQLVSRRYIFDDDQPVLNWDGLVENPVSIVVSNATTGIDLVPGADYTANWVNRTVTILNRVSAADLVNITAYELGGGSQLYRQNYVGNNVDDFVIVPVNVDEIYDAVLFVNGVNTQVVDWEAYYPANVWNQLQAYNRLDVVRTTSPTMYYRALQTVPAGIAITNTDYWLNFVPATQSKVLLEQVYNTTDALALTILGETSPIQYSWSTPQTQNILVTSAINSTRTVTLTNSVGGTNIPNMIVEVGGTRLRPYEGIEWIGDGSTLSFGLPQRGGYQQSIINAETDIDVYVDNVLQVQSIGDVAGAYSVTNWDGSNTPGRQVLFAQPPAVGSVVLITVSTVSAYLVSGNTLQLVNAPTVGDIISVTTWNDTAQQNILTLVFQGPEDEGVVITEPYDSTAFDAGVVNDDPGSFDYSEGITIPNNNLDLQRSGIQANRLWVTLNGRRLFDGKDFIVDGDILILASGPMANSDIVVVTEFTESIVPEAIAFRIFQDMRGVQATYRITPSTTTTLVQNLSATADIVYVRDANALTQPNLPDGIFGVCTINGERIMYRERDTALHTISGLMRGTGGTAATSHTVGTEVYDIGRGNLMFEEYQDYIDKSSSIGDGSTTVFYSDIDINNPDESSSIDIRAVEVYVGGVKQLPYVDVLTADLEVGLTYNISFVGTTDWNSIAGTVGITYGVNDKITVATTGTGTGTAVQQTTRYRWTEALFNPVAVEFVVNDEVIPPLAAPEAGNDITILVRRGKTWYRPGANTPSDGIALQETDTRAARFFRGI